ncbi:MAG: WYL domain-containing protein [Clostridia bacterium]|nr:WYL domain-containing protein [Clostridia bacterium]
MAKAKLKLLYLAKIFSEETDDAHGLTLPQIIEKLSAYDISADRKTLYQDFEELRRFGYDLISEQIGHSTYYFLGARDFVLPELKLLVDSVQAAKFITDKKSHELIRKLEALVSRHQAQQLHRQVFISGRVKAMNESIYYNIDKLHEAINADRKIRFQYYRWNAKKEMELRHNGSWYCVSPWTLSWDDEKYYLIAYDIDAGKIKHFRVDKMDRINITEDMAKTVKLTSDEIAGYTDRHFGMFGGEEVKVVLKCKNELAGVILDRFGKDVPFRPSGDEYFSVTVNVAESVHFFTWILNFGGGVSIVSPEGVKHRFKSFVADANKWVNE